ncbi:MAG: AI-2E family transporter [Methanobacterium sp.]|uniref:AI-2E family transporter n=1 Tax=Methanobacterium sp. TaxID=2164 RepID=UPI003D65A38C|nr:AI-2E family transporter [Methanobacterium sp.]
MIYKLRGTVTSAVFIISALLIISFFVLTPMISMIILGAVFAYVIRPISNKMLPHIKFETISIILAMIIVILPLILIMVIIINSLIESTPAIVAIAKNANLSSVNSGTVQYYLPTGFKTYADSLISSFKLGLEEVLKYTLNYIVTYLSSIPTIAFQLFIFFASTFYFAKDGDKLWEYINFTIPQNRTHYFDALFSETEKVLKSIFFGHFFTALLTGILGGVGFWLIGYPFASFLGILTGFFQLIPFIGHWPLPIILAAYSILTGNYLQAFAVIILGFLMSAIDIYIRPKISSKYADIHPLIFMLGFLCGPLVFGLSGFIIGPLILGVTYAAVKAYKKDKEAVNSQ